MTYTTDKKPLELTALTSLDDTDTVVVGDTSDTSEVVKSITWANVKVMLGSLYAAALGSDDNYVTDAEKVKLSNISVTQAVDLDTLESDTATNNAKVTNATHTVEVTGSGALTVDKTAITNKTLVSAAVGDQILVADASDTDNLKRVTVQTIIDLASVGGGITEAQAKVIARRYAVAL
jgi:hypothetical protein